MSAGSRAVPGKEGTGAGTNGETAPEQKKPDRAKRAEKTGRVVSGSGRTEEEKALRRQVRLLYASEDILIFHKPAGMLTQKAKPGMIPSMTIFWDYCRETGIIKEETTSVFRPSVATG